MEESLEKFELNKDTLNNFDSLMQVHLDQIEELTITSCSSNPKFYNIIGLCVNVNTLNLIGNLKINTNNIISNIFKPERIEKIVFDGVRLPTIKMFSKFVNLKSITLKNIKYSSIKGFLGLVNKENIESLIFENTDFCRTQTSIINDFLNIKYLEIKNCENCKFDSFEFLAKNRYLDKVILDPVVVPFDQLPNFVKGKAIKIVNSQLGKTTKKSLVNKFFMDENGINIVINSAKLKQLSENINFNRIDKMILNLNKNADLIEYMKLLKRVKKEVIISIKDLSYLNVDDANLFKEQLNVKKIKIVNSAEENSIDINDTYEIDSYIEIRNKIDEFISSVSKTNENVLEKIINVYKVIILSDKKELLNSTKSKKNQLNNITKNVYNDFNYAQIFSNCLACLNIPVKIIKGEDESGNQRFWNQVKVYDNWYNLDIYLDAKLNLKSVKLDKRPKYFLLSDKEFYKTHKPKTTNYEHCVLEIDKKIINNYFKEEKENFNWLINIISKIKKIFTFNRKALPAPNKIEINNYDTNEFTSDEIDLLNQIDELDDN